MSMVAMRTKVVLLEIGRSKDCGYLDGDDGVAGDSGNKCDWE